MYEFVGAEDWSNISLYDAAKWKNGLAFKNIDFSESGYPVIKIAELKNGITAQTKFTESKYSEDVFIKSGDIVFAWSGSPQTSIDTFRWEGIDGWLNQHIFKVTPKASICPQFLFFLLKSLRPRFVQIATNKQTTGLGHVTVADLKEMRVGIPSLSEQQRIVQILAPLHEKIENNRRMNETLEEMARAIFKSWFVDFDPVHAKAAGNAPAHMDAETAALFPNSFGDDGLPVGWNLHSLRDVTEKITKGTTPSKKDLNEVREEPCTINFLKVNNISDDGYFNQKSFEKIPESVHKNQLKRSILKKGDVLYSIAGTIGRAIIATDDILPSNTNQALAILRPKNGLCPSGFLSLILKDGNFQKELHSNIVQAVQANLSLSMISAQKFVFPPAEKIGQIFSPIENILKMQGSNYTENQSLAELRDTLLPKLMSGEIRVRDAEREVEVAI